MNYCGKCKEEILDDLYGMDVEQFFNTYFHTQEIWYFNNKEIDYYSKIISSIMNEHFKVSEEKFLIVGSAKIGFSLSPYKKLQSFCRGDINNRRQSDIDIAIVSTNIFNKLWDDLKLLKYQTYVNNYNQLSSNVFRGFINDKNINEQISLQADVIDKMDKCTIALRDEFGVVEPVNYRFYYSWDDLKRYTMDGIIKCKGDYHGI